MPTFYPTKQLTTLPYVCATCRSTFKRYRGWPYPDEAPCPRCGGVAVRVCQKFKSPPRSDDEQWRKVTLLLEAGCRFYSLPEEYPARLSETPAFIERHRSAWTPPA